MYHRHHRKDEIYGTITNAFDIDSQKSVSVKYRVALFELRVLRADCTCLIDARAGNTSENNGAHRLFAH